jgi:hypothetical protein
MLRSLCRVAPVLVLGCLMFAGAAPARDVVPHPGAGFIHATVTWPSGESKTGYLRWDDEEAYWDDLFHCGYRDLVWSEYVDLESLRNERRTEYFETHGLLDRLIYAIEGDDDNPLGWRMFLSRFGDLRSIEIRDGEDDFAITADGARHEIGGYANDSGSRLYLYPGEGNRERITWNDLSEIVFSPAPADREPYAERLYGLVKTTVGEFEGFIQWDKSECTSLDVLDGEDESGEVDLEMGSIRSITRTRDNSSEVVTRDGIEYRLHGSNDVNSSNRGIVIEVENLGRVVVPWKRFESVSFSEGHGSGIGRDAYANAEPLRGRVGTADGRERAGRLVVDLDEAFQWDLFNGTDEHGIEYNIPFSFLQRVEPGEQDFCRVTLQSGRVLELGDNQDTGQAHAGILVFASEGSEPERLLWNQIRWFEFDR